MKTLIKKVALDLIQKRNQTTTLEVKQELIATEPVYYWQQNFISTVLSELADKGELSFTNNGTFRIYELPTSAPANVMSTNLIGSNVPTTVAAPSAYKKIPLKQRGVVKVSLTDLAKLVQDNAGKFITLVHTKVTTGTQNVMNCQVLKGLTALGAIQVKEQGQLKTVYPNTLLEVRLKGTVYQLK